MTHRERPAGEEVEVSDSRLQRLEELEQLVEAIRLGQVDALVTSASGEEGVFTLRTADQPYRILVETMNEGAAMLDPDGLVLYCNSRLGDLLRLPPEQITGRYFQEFVADSHLDACVEMFGRAPVKAEQCESELRRASGGAFPVLLSISPATVDDRAVLCVIAADLGLKKQNERILASERLTRSIVEQALEAIVVCDGEGRIILSNGAARGLATHAVPGVALADALPFNHSGGNGIQIREVLAGAAFRGVEASLGLAEVLVSAAPLRGLDGDILGAVVSMTDITERKNYERELQRKSEELSRSNADLERFAFLASHDLQEPLRMVNTYTQLLLRQVGDLAGPDVAAHAAFIESGVKRMRQLIDDLLRYSRVTGSEDAGVEYAEASAALASALEKLQPLLSSQAAKVTFDAMPNVRISAEALENLFFCLIENAAKYSGGDVQIHVTAEPAGEAYVFSVRDNGPGIAPRYHEQIFRLFKRLQGQQVTGTGVGLALCKRIVDVHGGRIWVESAPGEGADFRFTLPAAKD